MMLSKKELSELPEVSTDVYKRNMIDRHLIKPKMQCLKIFVMHCSLEGINCKQSQLRKIHNQKNW